MSSSFPAKATYQHAWKVGGFHYAKYILYVYQYIARSAWSRHRKTFRIGDITREEAIQYLTQYGVGEELQGPIYDLVGGRMIHLGSAAEDARDGIPLDGRHITLHLDKMAFSQHLQF